MPDPEAERDKGEREGRCGLCGGRGRREGNEVNGWVPTPCEKCGGTGLAAPTPVREDDQGPPIPVDEQEDELDPLNPGEDDEREWTLNFNNGHFFPLSRDREQPSVTVVPKSRLAAVEAERDALRAAIDSEWDGMTASYEELRIRAETAEAALNAALDFIEENEHPIDNEGSGGAAEFLARHGRKP